MVWDLVKKKELTKEDESLILSLEEKLHQRFQADVEKIESQDTTEGQALSDYCEAAGLLRAIVTLKDIETREERTYGPAEMQERLRDAKKAQAKRWIDFLRQMGVS